MRRALLLVAAVAGLAGPLVAQQGAGPTGRIAGRVVDAEAGRPIAGARVAVQGSAVAVSTDIDGRFRTPPVPVGRQTVRVTAIGFQPVTADSVDVRGDVVATLNVALRGAVVELTELVVQSTETARSSSSAGLLAMQQAAPTVTDGISAEQIARSADGDAAEAVTRIPGVSVADDKVVVRGLGERYSATLLNGAELPSPDPQKKVVPLDLFPTALIDAIVTSKSATPDRPGDFAGGSVDVQTKDFPEQRVLSLSLGGTYNSLSTGKSLGLPALEGAAWLARADESRSLPPGGPPALGTDPRSPEALRYYQRVRNLWTPDPSSVAPNSSFGLTYGDQTAGGSLGWILSATYGISAEAQTDRLFRFIRSPSLEAEPLGAAGAEFDEASRTVDWGLIGNLSLRLGSAGKIGFRNLMTRAGTDLVYASDGFNVENAVSGYRTYQVRYTSRALRQHLLAGEHLLPWLGSLRAEWRASYAQAREDEPDNRSLQYLVGTTPEDPSSRVLATPLSRPQRWFARFLKDDLYTVQGDLSLPLSLRGPQDAILKAGAYYRTRDRRFDNSIFFAELQPGTPFDFRQLPPEQQFAPENIGSRILVNRVSALGVSYFADESITAGYGMLDLEVLPALRLTGGVRYEAWDFGLQFFEPGGEVPPDVIFADPIARTNRDWLWSANLTWALGERTNVRLAGFRSVARPDGRELAPLFFAPIAGQCSESGNAELRRTSVYNGDARLEFYPRPGEILAVTGFYKWFSEPIYEEIANEVGGSANCQSTPRNATSAENYGLELEARKTLDFLPGPLGGLSLGANYTYVRSRTVVSAAYELQGERPPLVLQSPHLVNVNLGWNAPDGRLGATVLLNYFDDRVVRYGLITPTADGLEIVPSVVERGRLTLDAKLTAELSRAWRVSASAQNLTGARVRLVQSTLAGPVDVGLAAIGRTFSLGMSYAVR